MKIKRKLSIVLFATWGLLWIALLNVSAQERGSLP